MIARGLLQAGAKVYLSGRKAHELDGAVEALSPVGAVHAIPADLGTSAGVKTLADGLASREERIHALFNNAGAAWGEPFGPRQSARICRWVVSAGPTTWPASPSSSRAAPARTSPEPSSRSTVE
jgi:NAD(P)-dependent dehydrogenase (short-subunit alcohol dehydrogenase family)